MQLLKTAALNFKQIIVAVIKSWSWRLILDKSLVPSRASLSARGQRIVRFLWIVLSTGLLSVVGDSRLVIATIVYNDMRI